jgi:hypothetical protein
MLVPFSVAAQTASPGVDPERDAIRATLALMNMAPVGILETCLPASATVEGAIASAQCVYGDGVVLYVRFVDQGSLQAAYDSLAAPTGMDADTGVACSDGAFEGEYTDASGAPAGRLFCLLGVDGPMAMWTDAHHTVLGLVQQPPESGYAGLQDAWLAARLPDAAAETDTEPLPTDAGQTDADTGPGPTDAAPASPQSSDSPGTIRQWATSATASSEYSSTDWSAMQATGSPNAPDYGQYPVSWAPLVDPGEPEWIDLTYDVSVVPTAVNIWEANGAGFVVRVEAWDEAAGDWLTLWHGSDPTPEQLMVFSPPLSATEIPTRRIRVTAGEGAAGWPYIDAVELVGTTAPE